MAFRRLDLTLSGSQITSDSMLQAWLALNGIVSDMMESCWSGD